MPAADQAGIASLVTKFRDEQRQANEQLGRIVVADRLAGLHERLIEHKQYITAYGDDLPEIRDWRWAGG